MLHFTAPAMHHREEAEEIVRRVESRSCQHCFAGIYCLRAQYGTEICMEDGVLYLRGTRRREGEVVYLPPIGAGADFAQALARLERVAAAEGKPWSFFSLTQDDVQAVESAAPGRFVFTEQPNWAEYLYDAHQLATLEGSVMAKKRHDASICLRLYGDQMEIEMIDANNIAQAAAFHHRWMEAYGEEKDFGSHLLGETHGVMEAFDHFEALGLRGILVRIGGETAAYSYGCVVGGDTFDIVAQKADYRFRNLYRIVFKELVARCATDCRYVNCEEDLGLPGLRRLKESYYPAFLLHKWNAVQREGRA